jgi:hypothetical protein
MAGLFLEWIDGFRLINIGLHLDSSYDSAYKYIRWEEDVTGIVEKSSSSFVFFFFFCFSRGYSQFIQYPD